MPELLHFQPKRDPNWEVMAAKFEEYAKRCRAGQVKMAVIAAVSDDDGLMSWVSRFDNRWTIIGVLHGMMTDIHEAAETLPMPTLPEPNPEQTELPL